MEKRVSVETVQQNGITMDCCRFGHGNEVFVILPGLSVQSVTALADAVAEAYQVFADEFTVYLFDRRKNLPEEYSVHDMAEDTAKVLRALKLDQINLFGASQGGMIAMEIAIHHPELFKKLILGSTSSHVTDGQYRLFEGWIQLAESGDAEGLYLAFGEALYPQEAFEQARGLLTEAAKTVTEEDLRRFIILARGLKDFNITEDLEKIVCPVLLIGSEDDRVLGAEASRIIAERLDGRPGFRFHLYDGYGHAAYDTAPDYKNRIVSFLC